MNNSQGLVVLVVEDEPLIRWSIAETVSTRVHTVIEAPGAAAARRVLDEIRNPIDVVLLDFRLPDSEDLTLLADIRRRSPESSVVMMTAFDVTDLRAGALHLGALAVI